jgi:hypothetical protein
MGLSMRTPLARRTSGGSSGACQEGHLGRDLEHAMHRGGHANSPHRFTGERLDGRERTRALLAKGHRVCLHAAPSFDGRDRKRLQRQLAYMLRPPVALDNVRLLPHGLVRLHFKQPSARGTLFTELTPNALPARLAALAFERLRMRDPVVVVAPPPYRENLRLSAQIVEGSAKIVLLGRRLRRLCSAGPVPFWRRRAWSHTASVHATSVGRMLITSLVLSGT